MKIFLLEEDPRTQRRFFEKIVLVMNLTVLFLTIACLHLSAAGFSQRIALSVKNVSLSTTFTEIEKQSDYKFFYDNKLVKEIKNISIEVRNASVTEVLDEVMKDQPLTYSIVDHTIVIKKKGISKTMGLDTKGLSSGQLKELSALVDLSVAPIIEGKVTDENGEALPGVSISVKGTQNSTSTNEEGMFSIDILEIGATLVFSFIGYETQEVTVTGQGALNIQLKGSMSNLDEVVVVGYGTQRKATLTGSIASTDDKMVKKAPVASLSNSLSGLLPGLTTLNRSGEPGQNVSEIYIRGRGTTGNTSPLVVVDGVPDEMGSWQRINSNDIEQISILKDASASIYGARAANGVILITTKRGKVGKPTFNYTFNQGITQPTRLPEMANSWEFADYVNQYRQTMQNLPPLYTAEQIQIMKDGTDPISFPNTDWVGTIFKKFSTQSMHNLNVRGGTESARYSMSGSYVDENSIVKNGIHDGNSFTLRSNVDVDITKNITFGLDLNGEMDDRTVPVLGDFGTQGSPLIPAFFPNGLPASLPGDAGENPAINLAGAGGYTNNKIFRAFLKPSFSIKIPKVEGLGVDGYFSFRQEFVENKRWRDTWLVYNYDVANKEYIEKLGGQVSKPDLRDSINKDKDYLFHFKVKYNRVFGDHSLESFVAFEQAEGEFRSVNGYRRDFISPVIQELFAGSGENMLAYGVRREWARQNVFGRINYNYKEKYLFETNLRYDGSYAFPKEKRWGFFPGFSAGWRISEEAFMEGSTYIDELKLRASYGQMGNDQINPFQYLSMYNLNPIGTHLGGGTQGVLLTGVAPNDRITWEVAENANIGLDASFWQGGLGLTLDVFKQRRSNILTARSTEVPIYTGLVLPHENIGIVENKGFEINISHKNNTRSKEQLSYSVSGNIGYAKNKILDISEPQDMPDYQKAEGSIIGAPLLYEAMGIFRTQEEVDSNPVMPGTRVGDLQYRDVNNDGTINAADRVRQDKGTVPEITFGLNASLEYKNFSLFVNFAGQGKAWTYFHKHARTTQNSLRDLLLNRYVPGSMDSKYPILPQEDGVGEGEVSGMPSTFWLQNASFLRLKTLQIGYTVPETFVSKFGLSSLMIFLNGSNLFTLSDIEWYDPEGSSPSDAGDGLSYSTGSFYPQTKIYNIGVNVAF